MHHNKTRRSTSEMGQYLPKSDVCVSSVHHNNGLISDVAASRFRADTVAKRFLTLERRILFPHFGGIRNIDSQRRSFGFYYCPFLLVERGSGDFCNSIGPKLTCESRSSMS